MDRWGLWEERSIERWGLRGGGVYREAGSTQVGFTGEVGTWGLT